MKDERSLGFLVMNGPESQDIRTVIALASAALDKGIAVELFLMHLGVLNSTLPELDSLCDRGAKVTVCSHNANELKAHRNEKFAYGSQMNHCEMIYRCTRYLAFV